MPERGYSSAPLIEAYAGRRSRNRDIGALGEDEALCSPAIPSAGGGVPYAGRYNLRFGAWVNRQRLRGAEGGIDAGYSNRRRAVGGRAGVSTAYHRRPRPYRGGSADTGRPCSGTGAGRLFPPASARSLWRARSHADRGRGGGWGVAPRS